MMWVLSVTMLALGVAGASIVAPSASLGEVLYRLTPGLLNIAQAGIERQLAPWVWEDFVLSVLVRPAWLIPFILAIAERERMIRDGSVIVTFAGGTGETWSSLVVRWGR